jgi:hypothetical protein
MSTGVEKKMDMTASLRRLDSISKKICTIRIAQDVSGIAHNAVCFKLPWNRVSSC